MKVQPQSPDMAAVAGQDQGQPQDQSTATAELVVEVSKMSDGTFKIERETGDQENAEQQGGGEQAGDTQPVVVNSVEDAVDVVKQMLNAGEQSSADLQSQNRAQQMQGYQEA